MNDMLEPVQSYEILNEKKYNNYLENKKNFDDKINLHRYLTDELDSYIFTGNQIVLSCGYNPEYDHPLSLISEKNSHLINDFEFLLDSKNYDDEEEINNHILRNKGDINYMEIADKLIDELINKNNSYMDFLDERIKIIERYINSVKKGNEIAKKIFVSVSNIWTLEE